MRVSLRSKFLFNHDHAVGTWYIASLCKQLHFMSGLVWVVPLWGGYMQWQFDLHTSASHGVSSVAGLQCAQRVLASSTAIQYSGQLLAGRCVLILQDKH
jgi:hypothetical protein